MHSMVRRDTIILTSEKPFARSLANAPSFLELKRNWSSASRPLKSTRFTSAAARGERGEARCWGRAGGFMLFLAPPEAHDPLRKVFAGRQVLEVKINAVGSQIIFS